MDLSSSQAELVSSSSSRRRKRVGHLQFRLQYRSEISLVIKYFTFASNILFWIVGIALLTVGLWAVAQKDFAMNLNALRESFSNPVLLLILSGTIIFVICFFGCVGALRENIYLILLYAVCVGITLLFLASAAVTVFVFRDWIKTQILESSIKTTIVQYRDDPDLQNLIDWIQGEWLHCCGLQSYRDWEMNIYFNCSSPGVEACGVPFSCCLPNTNPSIVGVNYACGYNVLKTTDSDPASRIYTAGCINQGDAWFQLYMVPVAGVIVGVALLQVIGICCASNLYADIRRQKLFWKREQRLSASGP